MHQHRCPVDDGIRAARGPTRVALAGVRSGGRTPSQQSIPDVVLYGQTGDAMLRSPIATLMLTLFIGGSCHAQVYRCIDPAGRSVYTDRPCAAEDEQRELEPSSREVLTANSGGQRFDARKFLKEERAKEEEKLFRAGVNSEVPLVPVTLKFKGGNFSSEVIVDVECVARGGLDAFEPYAVQLSQVSIDSSIDGRSHLRFVCKDKAACILTKRRGSRYTDTYRRALQKVSEETVAVDYSMYEESNQMENSLKKVVGWCSKVPPSLRWLQALDVGRFPD